MNPVTLNIQRLIACRKALGITKQEAAKRMQLSQPAYLRYEAGDRVPSIHVVHTMADVLNTSVDYLVGKTDDPARNQYQINAATEPVLFQLVECYKNGDEEIRGSLIAYLEKLKELKL